MQREAEEKNPARKEGWQERNAGVSEAMAGEGEGF